MFQKVVFSKLDKEENARMPDLSLREVFVLAPLVLFILWIGIYPQTFLRYTEPVSANIVQVVNPQTPVGQMQELPSDETQEVSHE